MQAFWRRPGILAKLLVFTPLVIVTVMFGAVVATLVTDAADIRDALPLVMGAIALYGASAALLSRMGLSAIADLEQQGMTDSLSLLPNRRALHRHLGAALKRGDDISIAMIDLDGFKLVNDMYGHGVGDELIRSAAGILTEYCSDDAQPYRLGGDEFAIALSGAQSRNLLEGICSQLLNRTARPIAIDDRRITIGMSIGLAGNMGATDIDSSELLRRADVAMYAAKRGGKGRSSWFRAALDRDIDRMRTLDAELRAALVGDQFAVHYQPLVDAVTHRIVAVESLLRWNRPDGRPVGPQVFIPMAEESGLINPIGLFVLRQSCRDAAAWPDIKLSVNISSVQLRNPEFPIQLGQILEETGFPPERLELEITETCLVLDPLAAQRSLDIIRSFGVTVALDDFGSGYASIGFLRQFRFDKLKIDRSLVVELGEDEGSRAMITSSVSMAQALNMNVTAEGVETEAQAALVRAAGCDQIQGWLYYRAMPPQDIAQHLGDEGFSLDSVNAETSDKEHIA